MWQCSPLSQNNYSKTTGSQRKMNELSLRKQYRPFFHFLLEKSVEANMMVEKMFLLLQEKSQAVEDEWVDSGLPFKEAPCCAETGATSYQQGVLIGKERQQSNWRKSWLPLQGLRKSLEIKIHLKVFPVHIKVILILRKRQTRYSENPILSRGLNRMGIFTGHFHRKTGILFWRRYRRIK